MVASPDPVETSSQDAELVSRCLHGDGGALLALRNQHYDRLVAIAINRGATATEARDLVADVWGDLTAPAPGKRPLLEKYRGRCPLSAWLITVVTHRFIDLRRRAHRFVDVADGTMEERMPAPESLPRDDDLMQVLRAAVREAYRACPPETLVMLKLVYVHGVTQRQVGRVWGWHESKVSRYLDRALAEMQQTILSQIKRADPHLEVGWDDFLCLCQSIPDLLA